MSPTWTPCRRSCPCRSPRQGHLQKLQECSLQACKGLDCCVNLVTLLSVQTSISGNISHCWSVQATSDSCVYLHPSCPALQDLQKVECLLADYNRA